MKAVGAPAALPSNDPRALIDFDAPAPAAPQGRDLLVEVKAVSVNPVDTKVRGKFDPSERKPQILGYDAAGTVVAAGPEATLFKPGDEVFYAGDLKRPGTNAELHLVDERIVGRKPATLGFGDAAALPLTAITAWEALFDRMRIARDGGAGDVLLILGAAGGVGSIAVQIARRLTQLTVVGTASRPETRAWVESLGAHHVIDHSRPLQDGLTAAGLPAPRYVLSLTATDRNFAQIVDILEPQGTIVAIDDPKTLDVTPLKSKAATFAWEFMFARPIHKTRDMEQQHLLLNEVADLVDRGVLVTTARERLAGVTAENLRAVHARVESGTTIGKIVLEGF